MKNIVTGFKTRAAMVGVPATLALGTCTAFASDGTPLPTIAITQEMLTPLVEGVISNIGVVLPIGIGLFAIMLGVKLVPRIVGWFVK